MDLAEFEERARRHFGDIPPQFRERIAGPVVVAKAKRHPSAGGMYTLGECVHAPSVAGEADLLSTVFVYYGSFVALARRDRGFDVDAELKETLRHEVQHHLEDRAGIATLSDYDWAVDQNALRRDGAAYAPQFWLAGETVDGEDPALRVVDGDLFLELALPETQWRRAARDGLAVTIGGATCEIAAGDIEKDEEMFEFEGPFDVESSVHHEPADGDLLVVVRRRRSLADRLRPGRR